MARVEKLVLREIRLPLREPFRISSGTVHDRRILIVELMDVDGASGWSECVAGEQLRDSWPVGEVGKSLLTSYSMVFEVISIVLLVAIIGSLVLARSGRAPSRSQS